MSGPARERRGWGVWLVVSLCINFFLIGVIVMGLIVARNRAAMGAGGGGGGLPPEVVLQMLPPSGAVKMCNAIGGRLETFKRLGREIAEARRAMFQIFRADSFDPPAFNAALARVTAAQVAILREREATVADVVAKLTPDERRHFTRQIAQRFWSWRKASPQPRATLAAMCKSFGVGNLD